MEVDRRESVFQKLAADQAAMEAQKQKRLAFFQVQRQIEMDSKHQLAQQRAVQ